MRPWASIEGHYVLPYLDILGMWRISWINILPSNTIAPTPIMGKDSAGTDRLSVRTCGVCSLEIPAKDKVIWFQRLQLLPTTVHGSRRQTDAVIVRILPQLLLLHLPDLASLSSSQDPSHIGIARHGIPLESHLASVLHSIGIAPS